MCCIFIKDLGIVSCDLFVQCQHEAHIFSFIFLKQPWGIYKLQKDDLFALTYVMIHMRNGYIITFVYAMCK